MERAVLRVIADKLDQLERIEEMLKHNNLWIEGSSDYGAHSRSYGRDNKELTMVLRTFLTHETQRIKSELEIT